MKADPSRFVKVFWKALVPLPKGSNGWIRQLYAVLNKKVGLRNPENQNRVETGLVIRPFTVWENCQISSLASIRKSLGTENTPFLVSSYSKIASENVSGRVSGENFKNPGKAFFTNPEESQSGRVQILSIRRGPDFANPEGSCFCQSGGVLFLPIREGPNFGNQEGSCFCQSGRVLFLPIRKRPAFAHPDGPSFANPEGS